MKKSNYSTLVFGAASLIGLGLGVVYMQNNPLTPSTQVITTRTRIEQPAHSAEHHFTQDNCFPTVGELLTKIGIDAASDEYHTQLRQWRKTHCGGN